VRVPTLPGTKDVFLDLNADGLADAKVSPDGTLTRVSATQAAAVDRASGGAGTSAAKARAAQAARVRLAGPAKGRALDATPAAEDLPRSPTILVFASLLAVAVGASQLHEASKTR
jgi:hypothetical protein